MQYKRYDILKSQYLVNTVLLQTAQRIKHNPKKDLENTRILQNHHQLVSLTESASDPLAGWRPRTDP